MPQEFMVLTCAACGYQPDKGTHYFTCPKCGAKENWILRRRKDQMQKQDKPKPGLTTINVDGGMGTWEITFLPEGATSHEQAVKIYATSTGLLPIVRMFPTTINAIFVGQGVCVVDAEGV